LARLFHHHQSIFCIDDDFDDVIRAYGMPRTIRFPRRGVKYTVRNYVQVGRSRLMLRLNEIRNLDWRHLHGQVCEPGFWEGRFRAATDISIFETMAREMGVKQRSPTREETKKVVPDTRAPAAQEAREGDH